MSKIGYATFIRHRLSGFEVGDVPRATPADLDAYPSFRDRLAAAGATAKYLRPICRGPIAYENREPLERDLEHLRNAIEGQPVAGAFMNAPSPGIVALFQPNEYYDSTDEYLDAHRRGDEDRVRGHRRGRLLPADRRARPRHGPPHHVPRRARRGLRRARGRPRRRASTRRCATCPATACACTCAGATTRARTTSTSSSRRSSTTSCALKASALQFEAANPRHAHEWAVWRANADKIPDDKVLIPGVLDTTANYIEHPELVAERLGNFVDIVGAERVMAGTDCGFGTWAGFGPIDPTICWAKLARDGRGREARRASGRAPRAPAGPSRAGRRPR